MGKFNISVAKNGPVAEVIIGGIIDEDVDFSAYPLSGVEKVEMKLGGITSINSCGIREWIKWLGTAPTAQVLYHECPKIIVDQINMVQGFLPSQGKVMSFYVPYYSDEASTDMTVLFTLGKEFTETSLTPPAEVRDGAGNLMEMDVIEAKYFKFIKR